MGPQPKITITAKLVLVTIALILAVVIPLALLTSSKFQASLESSYLKGTADLAGSKSSEIEGQVFNWLEKIRTVTNLMLQDFADDQQRKRALDLVFYRDLDLVNIEIYQLKDGQPSLYKRETNEAYLRPFGLARDYIDKVRREKPFPLLAVFSEADRVQIRNTTLRSGAPLFTIAVPFPDNAGIVRHIAVADLRLDRLQRAFSMSGSAILYLVDSQGVVLAHTDDKLTFENAAFSEVPIVQEALSKSTVSTKGQKKRFFDPNLNDWYMGAYSKTAFGLTVIAQGLERVILEPARQTKRDAFEIGGYVLSGALFLVIIFAISLSYPIEKLHEATLLVARGNFDVRAKVRTSDEVGALARAFNNMVDGLKERDKVKNILNKFHGSSVTEDLMKGDLQLGGTRKQVTVLFSDIRDFTKFSEGHTPEEVVDMLNEYFEIMVGIITRNHGIVDKFVGDAIMAIWGAPNSTGEDPYYAVKASLEMREALAKLNERRLGRQQTAIKIGIGLHSGPAISGTIGSLERMEYTVIGDTVNMASRIESSTKAFGSDLLVSDALVKEVEKRFRFEFAGSAEVKGKTEPIKMYKVRGYIKDNGTFIEVKTPYSDYEAGHADKVKVA